MNMIATVLVGLIFMSLLGSDEAQNLLTAITLIGLPVLLVLYFII